MCFLFINCPIHFIQFIKCLFSCRASLPQEAREINQRKNLPEYQSLLKQAERKDLGGLTFELKTGNVVVSCMKGHGKENPSTENKQERREKLQVGGKSYSTLQTKRKHFNFECNRIGFHCGHLIRLHYNLTHGIK